MPEYRWIDDGICTIENFFSAAECRAWIEQTERLGYDAAPVTTILGPIMAPDIRNNTRVMIDTREQAARLWSRVRSYVPGRFGDCVPVGVNERLRFYRYDPGQSFAWHADGCFQRSPQEYSCVTFMIYLNEGFEGGATLFQDHVIVPRTGMALLFEHRLVHKGEEVQQGQKYVLRSDIMYARAMHREACHG